MKPLISNFILFFVVSGIFLTLFPNVHAALILSFLWTVALMYKYAHKLVGNQLNSGISAISSELQGLQEKQETLKNQINALSNEIVNSKNYFNTAITSAQNEANDLSEKRTLEHTKALEEQRQKYQQTFKMIEKEYSILVQQKLTELIISKLIAKIQEPENVKNVTLTGINKALQAIANAQKIL